MIWLDEGGRQRHIPLIAPPDALSGAVEHFWIHQRAPREIWRVVPDLSAHVIFTLSANEGANLRVVGPRSTHCDIDMRGRELTIGARLAPAMLPHLIRTSAAQLRDCSESIDVILGATGSDLAAKIGEANQNDRLMLLSNFLSSRLVRRVSNWPCRVPSVVELSRQWGLSRRAAYNRSLDWVGLPPKLALRIAGLHRALSLLQRGVSLADAAAKAGYADQSHFTRESVHFLAEPPAAWRRRGCSSIQDESTSLRG